MHAPADSPLDPSRQCRRRATAALRPQRRAHRSPAASCHPARVPAFLVSCSGVTPRCNYTSASPGADAFQQPKTRPIEQFAPSAAAVPSSPASRRHALPAAESTTTAHATVRRARARKAHDLRPTAARANVESYLNAVSACARVAATLRRPHAQVLRESLHSTPPQLPADAVCREKGLNCSHPHPVTALPCRKNLRPDDATDELLFESAFQARDLMESASCQACPNYPAICQLNPLRLPPIG